MINLEKGWPPLYGTVRILQTGEIGYVGHLSPEREVQVLEEPDPDAIVLGWFSPDELVWAEEYLVWPVH